jgi:hypothetical protein
MFINVNDKVEFSNTFVDYAEVTADDVVVLDTDEANYFRISKQELDTFAKLYTNDDQTVYDSLVKIWEQRGIEPAPVFGARVIRNDVVYDIAFN